MFEFSADKMLIIVLIAALLIGPKHLPDAARWLTQAVRRVRAFSEEAKTRAEQELGQDLPAVSWETLDPRRYDPRRIIADALTDAGAAPGEPAHETIVPVESAPDRGGPVERARPAQD